MMLKYFLVGWCLFSIACNEAGVNSNNTVEKTETLYCDTLLSFAIKLINEKDTETIGSKDKLIYEGINEYSDTTLFKRYSSLSIPYQESRKNYSVGIYSMPYCTIDTLCYKELSFFSKAVQENWKRWRAKADSVVFIPTKYIVLSKPIISKHGDYMAIEVDFMPLHGVTYVFGREDKMNWELVEKNPRWVF